MKVLSIDVETSGLIPAYDFITQIGAVVMEDGEVVSEPFYTHVQPDWDKFKISVRAAEVQIGGLEGFMDWIEKLKQAPPMLEVAKSFSDWAKVVDAKSMPNIAYKADFDWPFIENKIFSYKSVFKTPALSPMWICVLNMARTHFGGSLPDNRLDTVIAAFGLDTQRSGHDALQDAILCGKVFHALGGAYPQLTKND